ncbi:hypothetical protein AAEU31_02370 [Pseudoalteromonas sp. SSMSWG5]|jgi:hypothetical protein|uniref:hypothetical protein n=1 Tax=Pseudoalteromonas sp. SSMSWG5 TaxID=3139396 RepID=UPI003BA97AA7
MDNSVNMVEIFQMFQAQYSQVDKLWNYFGVVSLAVAGFTIGNEKATRTIKEPIAIVIGYLAFCVGNYTALIYSHKFLVVLANKYNEKACSYALNHLKVITVERVSVFYILVVITFTLTILVVSYSRLKLKQHDEG